MEQALARLALTSSRTEIEIFRSAPGMNSQGSHRYADDTHTHRRRAFMLGIMTDRRGGMWPTPCPALCNPRRALPPGPPASKQALSCRYCINLGSRLLPPSVLGLLLLDGLGSSEKGRLHAVQPELDLAMFDSSPGRPPVLFCSLTDSRCPFP